MLILILVLYVTEKVNQKIKVGRSEQSRKKIILYKQSWFQVNKEKIQSQIKEKRNENPILKNMDYFSSVKQRFNLSIEEVISMYDACEGRCEICGIHYTEMSIVSKSRLNIDHCHSTNTLRGLLCHNCNIGLGNFQDNKMLLQKAINYLNKYELSERTENNFCI